MTVSDHPAVQLASQLIRRYSITPDDADCQELICERLRKVGFIIEPMPFGPVKNLWARWGTSNPLFVFAGHTDVVPSGPADKWKHHPFEPIIDNGYLYGRGSADMKSSIAAMVVAVEKFIASYGTNVFGSIGFLITSDEEGDATDGTVKVVEHLEARSEKITYCIVGEPTSTATVGDTIKNGRRGSLGAKLVVYGVQGHVAYPERADNPIHRFAPALSELCTRQWDEGNEFFSPTTFQFSNIKSGAGAVNVVPGDLEAQFNFRFSSGITADELKAQVCSILDRHNLKYDIEWRLSGHPFLTQPGTLTEVAANAIATVTGIKTQLSTTGGTSDARFIAPTGAQVIELGLVNETIHKTNECVKACEIDSLAAIYERILMGLLLQSSQCSG